MSHSMKYEDIQKLYHALLPQREKLLHLFRQYLQVGGFPEWFKIQNKKQWQQILLDDYISLILFKDIVFVYNIKDPLLL